MKIVAKVRTAQKPSEQLSLTKQRLGLLNARGRLMDQAKKLRKALDDNKAAIATNAEAMAKLAGPTANTEPNDFNEISPPQAAAQKPQPAKKSPAKNKLKPEQRVEIVKLIGEGATYKELATRFDVSISAIEYWAKK
jgi:DNA-directed RNA polymerase specialized sigma24 family protein